MPITGISEWAADGRDGDSDDKCFCGSSRALIFGIVVRRKHAETVVNEKDAREEEMISEEKQPSLAVENRLLSWKIG